MQIKEIYISSFGGIKNLKIMPEKGLNVIYGDNENGKTTVMSFIKMMFYGNERGSAQISKNIRKKYTPWDGSPMAGSIDFCQAGRNYRIEREFRSSNSTDRVTLCDLDLGTKQTAPPDIGTELFGLTAAAFERSVFIGQFGFPENDVKAEGEINSKLSNIALTGDESISYETVNARLLKAKTALMSKGGNAGIYDKKLKELEALKSRLSAAITVHENYEKHREKAAKAEAEIKLMEKKAEELKAKISAENDVRNTEKLKNLLDLKARLDELNKKLLLSDGSLADEMYLKSLQFCLGKVESASQRVTAKESEAERFRKSISAYGSSSPEEKKKLKAELETKISELEEEKSQLEAKSESLKIKEREILFSLADTSHFKKKFNPLFLISAAGVLILSIILFAFSLLIPAFITCGLALIFTALGFAVRPVDTSALEKLKNASQKAGAEIASLDSSAKKISEQLSELKIKLQTIDTALSSDMDMIENQKSLLLECEKELEKEKQLYEKEKSNLFALFARYKSDFGFEDIKASLDDIQKGANEQKEIKQQINYILKDIGNISYEEAKNRLNDINPELGTADFEALKSEYEGQRVALTEAKTALASINASAGANVAAAENPEILRKKISELTEETAKQKAFCEELDIAVEILAKSFAQVRQTYGSTLEKNAAEIFSGITAGKYSSVIISKSLGISVEESNAFGNRDAAFLSSGTADQAYLSMRLAIASLISENNENLPVFMDDSLAQYDDKRTETALEFLKGYMESGQGLLFTCHGSVIGIAEKLGANIIRLG